MQVCGDRPSRHLAPKCHSPPTQSRFYSQQAYHSSPGPLGRRRGGKKQNDVNQDIGDWLRRRKERDRQREEERENRKTASPC